jgi:hypothetical protein
MLVPASTRTQVQVLILRKKRKKEGRKDEKKEKEKEGEREGRKERKKTLVLLIRTLCHQLK